MSKSYEVQGIIHSIGKTKEFGNNGFKKREFVVELNDSSENPEYPNYILFELIKDKCSILDVYNVKDIVKVTYNLQGRLWKKDDESPERCFVSLQAWKIALVETESKTENLTEDDIPF